MIEKNKKGTMENSLNYEFCENLRVNPIFRNNFILINIPEYYCEFHECNHASKPEITCPVKLLYLMKIDGLFELLFLVKTIFWKKII